MLDKHYQPEVTGRWRGHDVDYNSEDARHGLKEVAALDIVVEGEQKKGISVSASSSTELHSGC